jgi:hypothetical protein
MGGNRKHGYMRGAHHVKNVWEKPFFCDGCKKKHGPKIDRFKMLDGRMLCTRQYYRDLNKQRNDLIVAQKLNF